MPRATIAALYAQLAGKLTVVLVRKLGLPQDIVQDAVQDLFLTLLDDQDQWHKIAAMDEPAQFVYTFHMARTRALKELEYRQKRMLQLLTDADPTSGDLVETTERDVLAAVAAALEQMTPPYREVLQALLIEQKSAKQISSELGRPVNTIYQHIHRGLQELRKRLRRKH